MLISRRLAVMFSGATLKARVSQLEADLLVSTKKSTAEPLAGLAQGTDVYEPMACFEIKGKDDYLTENIPATWDRILAYVGPSLLGECTDDEFLEKIKLCLFHAISDNAKWQSVIHGSVIVPIVTRDEITVQLRALGYMAPGTKRRAVSDQKVYWRLTDEGERRLIQIQAVKRPQPKES